MNSVRLIDVIICSCPSNLESICTPRNVTTVCSVMSSVLIVTLILCIFGVALDLNTTKLVFPMLNESLFDVNHSAD